MTQNAEGNGWNCSHPEHVKRRITNRILAWNSFTIREQTLKFYTILMMTITTVALWPKIDIAHNTGKILHCYASNRANIWLNLKCMMKSTTPYQGLFGQIWQINSDDTRVILMDKSRSSWFKIHQTRIYGAWQLFKPPPLHATGDSAVPGGGK